MRSTFLDEYKKAAFGWPHPVRSPLFPRMNVSLIIRLILFLIAAIASQTIPHNYYNKWMVVAQNSSGQLFFDITPLASRIFVWTPHKDSVLPSLFCDQPPKVIPDSSEMTTSGTIARIVSSTTLRVSSQVPQEAKEEVAAEHSTKLAAIDKPTYAALELPATRNETKPAKVSRDFGRNILFHSSKVADMMEILSEDRSTPNLTVPNLKSKVFNTTQASNDSIVYAKDEVSLTKESSRLHHIRREKIRARRQITPDITTELYLSDAQLNSLKAQVNRRFLTGYDCSNPQEVKPISSFVRDPCEPAKANDKDTYEIDPMTQCQIIQYETRREFQGTRCEKYISQFTYYCGTVDHSSPYPQETFYRHPKVMVWDECKV